MWETPSYLSTLTPGGKGGAQVSQSVNQSLLWPFAHPPNLYSGGVACQRRTIMNTQLLHES